MADPIYGFSGNDTGRIANAVSFYEHNPRYPISQRKYGGPPPIVPIKLLIATEDFEVAFPCSDLMFGACVPFEAADASGSGLQQCHTEGTDDYTVYQIRAASCTGGSATISQEIVQSGDYLYCWFNSQSLRWEVIQHIFNRCSYSCGWNPAAGSIFTSSDTISGTMSLDILDTGGGGKSIKATGTGEAIATGLMKLSSFATSPIIIQCYPYTPPDSMTGQYWFGVAGGPGVLVDLDAELIWFVTLNSDGTINTTYNAASYPTTDWQTDAYSEKSPRAKMGWCQLDCDRLTILGYGDNGDTATPLAHWPIDQPHVDTLLAFGTTVPAATDGTWWNVKAICTSGLCAPCSEYTDWPTPAKLDVQGLATLALSGTAPHTIDMTDLEDLSGIIEAVHLTDPSGVEWNSGAGTSGFLLSSCHSRFQQIGVVGTHSGDGGSGTSTINANVTVSKLFGFEAREFEIACVDFGALPSLSDTGNTYIGVMVGFVDTDEDVEAWSYADVQTTNVAIYKLIGHLPDDTTPTAFGLVCVYHTGIGGTISGVGLPMSCSDPRNVPYIAPGSWPSTIDAAWVPTAPVCGSDPPTTSTSTTTDTSTTTVSSTTTETSTTTVSSTTTDTSTTTVSSTTTDTSTTTSGSTTESTTTDTSTTDTSTTTSGSTTESTTTDTSTTDTSTTGTGSTTTETSTTTLNCGSYTTEWTWNGSSWDLTVNNCPEGCTPVTPGGVGGTVGDMVESSCS